jgi:hypothetical protein
VKELIQNIQNHEPLGPSLLGFIRRYPWAVAFMILFVAMTVGFFRVDQIDSEQERDRADRRAENLLRDKQFCRAIPNSTVAGAHALVNILEVQNRAEGASEEEISELKKLGLLYTEEARRLALKQLPECPKILVTRPTEGAR